MKNKKLTLVNFDFAGNKTTISAKYNFIIKILNYLGQKDYISIEYASAPIPQTFDDVAQRLDDNLNKKLQKIDDQFYKNLEGMRPPYKNNSKKITKKIKPLSKKLPIKKTK
jgi:hypothetical protein